MRKARILVTGGAGFIGSHLVDKLLEMENVVIVYDSFDQFYQGKEKNLQHNLDNDRFKLVQSDIMNYQALVSVMKDVDVVFHDAAQCGIRYCISNPLKANTVNVAGTLNVLQAARQENVKKVIYASSSAIFGATQYVPMDEKHPTSPNSPYGVSKLAAEHYCLVFHRVYNMDVTCLRYFSVYGPRGRPDQVIHEFVSAVSRNQRPVIFGEGAQTRDFTFVNDVIDATVRAVEREDTDGHVFNIGYGSEISINEVFDKVVKLMKKNLVTPIHKETYRGEFLRTFADNTKARKILRWKPKVDLEEGLRIFIKWFNARQGEIFSE